MKTMTTDDLLRAGRYRVEIADLVTLRSRGKLFWDAIAYEVSWATAESMVAHERATGGSARIIDLDRREVVPADEPPPAALTLMTDPITGAQVLV